MSKQADRDLYCENSWVCHGKENPLDQVRPFDEDKTDLKAIIATIQALSPSILAMNQGDNDTP